MMKYLAPELRCRLLGPVEALLVELDDELRRKFEK